MELVVLTVPDCPAARGFRRDDHLPAGPGAAPPGHAAVAVATGEVAGNTAGRVSGYLLARPPGVLAAGWEV
jgi:hypothetical protein